MTICSRAIVAGLLFALTSTLLLAATAGTAHADRCEPDEIVFRAAGTTLQQNAPEVYDTLPQAVRDFVSPGYESRLEETNPIVCDNMDEFFYGNVACNDTTLMNCVNSLDRAGTAYMFFCDYEKWGPGVFGTGMCDIGDDVYPIVP